MSDIQNLDGKMVKPLTLLSKTNEIIDVVNEGINSSYSEQNPLLTSNNGVCSWVITHNLNTEDVGCTVYEGEQEVFVNTVITSENVVTVTINSNSNISAETYSVLVVAKGGVNSSETVRIDIDTELSTTSENPVQNKVITAAIQDVETRNGGYTVTSPALIQSNGTLTWVITHNLNTTNLLVTLYNSSGNEMVKNVNITSANSVTLTFSSNTNASAGDYRAVIFTTKVITVDSELFNNRANVDLNNISNAGKVNFANISLPSNTYETVVTGASGTEYIAPADGWYFIRLSTPQSAGGWSTIRWEDGRDLIMNANAYSNIPWLIPVTKGTKITVLYASGLSISLFRFYYAIGSESEYTP